MPTYLPVQHLDLVRLLLHLVRGRGRDGGRGRGRGWGRGRDTCRGRGRGSARARVYSSHLGREEMR